MNSIVAEIWAFGKTLVPGETANGILCPFCNGGRHRERSFSVTLSMDGILLYCCHRAKCKVAGRVNFPDSKTIRLSDNREEILRNFNPRPFLGATKSILDSLTSKKLLKWGLTFEDIKRFNLKETVEDIPRLIIPIRDFKGTFLGNISRSISDEDTRPKTLTYKEVDLPWLGFFNTPATLRNEVLLVEDCISAMRSSSFIDSISLMGCHITQEELFDVLKLSDRIYICLDRDATDKAYALQKRYSFIAPNLKVIPLQGKDIKELRDEEIQDILSMYVE